MKKKSHLFIDRTGERHTTKEGYEVEIIEYFGSGNATIKFLIDNTIRYNVEYKNIKNKSVRKLKNRIGLIFLTNEGYKAELIKIETLSNCTIKFYDQNNTIITNVSFKRLENGQVYNPYHPSVCGIGYYGVGKYKAKIKGKTTPHYQKWIKMIQRCYSKVSRYVYPTYVDITVCEEWHNFQIFAEWYHQNWEPHMDGWELDKDILFKGNKIYSPETYCFVPRIVNSSVKYKAVKNGTFRGVITINGKYIAQLTRPGKGRHLGTFNTPEEAFYCYKFHKELRIKELADEWKPLINSRVYSALYNWKIEITD